MQFVWAKRDSFGSELAIDYVMTGKAWWPVVCHIASANRKKEQMPVLLYIQSGTLGQVVVVPAFRVVCPCLEIASCIDPQLCLLDVFVSYEVENQY